MYTLSNLVKVLHFEEIDNYIPQNKRNMTESGMMGHKKAKRIFNNLKSFFIRFIEYGNGVYNLSDSLFINVTTANDHSKNLEEIKFEDKGIIVIINPSHFLKSYGHYALQIISFDSPLIPIITSGDKNESTVNNFISIILYHEDYVEIKMTIGTKSRPRIIYDKTYYKYLKDYFFYNEKIQDLDDTDFNVGENYNYNNKEYFRCTLKHFTDFTAGNYYYNYDNEPESKPGIGKLGWIMIIIGSYIALLLLIIITVRVINRRRNKFNIKLFEKDNIDLEMMED